MCENWGISRIDYSIYANVFKVYSINSYYLIIEGPTIKKSYKKKYNSKLMYQ
jgi:hypothetical protein